MIHTISRSWWVSGLALCSVLSFGVGCVRVETETEVSRSEQAIVYGNDNRQEAWEFADSTMSDALIQSSVALVPASRIVDESSANPSLSASTLLELVGLCPEERFALQPCAADCSGTLISPDLVLTAGHCLVSTPCPDLRLVFDYRTQPDGSLRPLQPDAIFHCSNVVASRFDALVDYALIRLDRPALGRLPARVRVGNLPLPVSSELVFAGYPTGLPLKLAADAWVSRNRDDALDYFAASLDAFPGSSGSGVFAADTLELVGVLARGPQPAYGRTSGESCVRPVYVPDSTPGAVESTYVSQAIQTFCAVADDAVLCACGNGLCESVLGEDTRTCPQDCGSTCGDEVCNASEDGNNCYSDCGTCGNAVCELHEVSHLSCCEDCGCPGGFACGAGSCALRLGNVNGDGQVDAQDATLLDQVVAGARPEYFAGSVADVDCSGAVDAGDASQLRDFAEHGSRLACERVDSIAAGASHTCVLTGSGSVHCWGAGSNGQLGHASIRNVGDDEPPSILGQVDVGGRATQIVAGRQHTCALLQDQTVRCWGAGALGQLGYGNTLSIGDDERPVLAGPVPLGATVRQITAGGFHTCALLTNGVVKCWGENVFGQLGYGHGARIGDDETPASIQGLRFDAEVIELAAGLNHTCALLSDATVHCWGSNTFGQLGYGHTRNVGDDESVTAAPAVQIGAEVSHIAAGWMNTCAILSDGQLKCWGDNGMQQLGYGTFLVVGDDELPASVEGIAFEHPVAQVSIGELRTCVRTEDGSVRCWGLNSNGQLGQGHKQALPPGTRANMLQPIVLGAVATNIAAGGNHSCAVTVGQVQCWGKNEFGQLGYGHTLAIGDDETVLSAGAVPLYPTISTDWFRVNSLGLKVYQTDRGSNDRSSNFELYVENAGTTRVSRLRLLYLLDTGESPESVLSLDMHGKPHWRGWIETEGRSTLRAVAFEYLGRPLEPGWRTPRAHCGGGMVRLHFEDWSKTWTELNDYSATGRSRRGASQLTDRIQMVDSEGVVVYGWTRN